MPCGRASCQHHIFDPTLTSSASRSTQSYSKSNCVDSRQRSLQISMADLANLHYPHHRRQFPTNEEVLLSKSVIKELDRDIELVQVEMSRLQTRLESLQRKRANYASYVSPLRRLPTEMLSEIIGICIDNDVDITTIAAVCTRLRDVAHGMTAIWSKVLLRPKSISLDDYGSVESCRRCFGPKILVGCEHCREVEEVVHCRHCYGSENVG
jgi:hypothetical protein